MSIVLEKVEVEKPVAENIHRVEETSQEVSSGPIEVDRITFFREGMCMKCKVVSIRLGKFRDFVPEPEDEERKRIWRRRANRTCFHVILKCGPIEIEDIITVSSHPNSRMYMLSKCYNEIVKGSVVKVCIENGRPRISC